MVKKLRILLTVLGAVILIMALGYMTTSWLEDIVRSKVKGVPALQIDSLDIDLLDRRIRAFRVEFRKNGHDLMIDELVIRGIAIIPLIMEKNHLVIDGMAIKGMTLIHRQSYQSGTDGAASELPSIELGEIRISESEVSVFNQTDSLQFWSKVEAGLEGVTDRDIGSADSIISRLKYLTLDSLIFISEDRLYSTSVEEIVGTNDEVRVRGLKSTSNYGKYTLGHQVGHEIDWIDASIDSMVVRSKPHLHLSCIQKIDVYNPVFNAFRDKRLPFPNDNRPPLVRDVLGNQNQTFSVDSISIHDGKIVYEELVNHEKGPGFVSFEQLDATVTSFASYHLKKGIRPRLIASCQLYGKVQLYADISFPTSPQMKHTLVKGKLAATDLSILNNMTSYVSELEIKSGRSENMEFEFSHTQTHATGEMKFVYNDLSISFLEAPGSEGNEVVNDIKAFFVNTFVIDKNNDLDGTKFRLGKIDQDRDIRKSMFNFWWIAILDGLKSSTGVDTSGQKVVVNQ